MPGFGFSRKRGAEAYLYTLHKPRRSEKPEDERLLTACGGYQGMMTAYVRFCGGCNEGYSRAAAVRYLKEQLAGRVEFFPHDSSVPRDIGIILQGCPSRCARREDSAPCGLYIEICSMQDAGRAAETLLRSC